ncbi:MAG: hypothetical protein ABSE68_00335 [Minisyncoccia bacterium]
MKTTVFLFTVLISILFAGCCASYTISSDELVKTGKKVVKEWKFEYNAAQINVINPYQQVCTVIIGNESIDIGYRERAFRTYDVNLILDGSYIKIPVSVISGNMRVATRDFYIRPRNTGVTTWVIQIYGNQISLVGS